MSVKLATIAEVSGDGGNSVANICQPSSSGGDIEDDPNYQNSFPAELRERVRHAKRDHDNHIQDFPPPANKLGTFSTACLLINRIIGTGIFETPRSVWLGTRSVSGALFMWCVGSLIAFSGLFVYLELGLTVPRYVVRGEWRSVPRSGGEKNYLEYMFRKPKFLASSTYAVIFICLGNTSGNGIIFGTKVLQIAYYPNPVNILDHRTGWIIKGLAVGAVTSACLLHGAWRSGGIWVQNTLAVVKLGILWFFIIAGLATYSGNVHGVPNPGQALSASSSFQNNKLFTPDYGAHGWITTLLDVTFSYSGFGGANYVLSEVKNPQKKLKLATIGTVALISVSYILMNISFFTVVRPEQLMAPGNPSISSIFLLNIFNRDDRAKRDLPVLVAISAFGNIVATTFVISKVKQEIAKEGVIPFSHFFRSQYLSPYRRLFRMFNSTPSPGYQEKTPAPALLLHWTSSLIMILSPPAVNTYTLFTRLFSYIILAWFGVFLSGGLLYHGYYKQYLSDRSGGSYRWNEVAGFRPWFGPTFPLIYFVVCTAIVAGHWVPPLQGKDTTTATFKWFVVPTVGICFFAAGIVYWFGLTRVLPLWNNKTLRVTRKPYLDADLNFEFEEVITRWIAGPEEDSDESDPFLS